MTTPSRVRRKTEALTSATTVARTWLGRTWIPLILIVALLLRLVFPLADPPVRLSWSNGM